MSASLADDFRRCSEAFASPTEHLEEGAGAAIQGERGPKLRVKRLKSTERKRTLPDMVVAAGTPSPAILPGTARVP